MRLNGFEVLELIGGEVAVIFITPMKYAVRAFDVHAVDYPLNSSARNDWHKRWNSPGDGNAATGAAMLVESTQITDSRTTSSATEQSHAIWSMNRLCRFGRLYPFQVRRQRAPETGHLVNPVLLDPRQFIRNHDPTS
jgi:hypothetical protein